MSALTTLTGDSFTVPFQSVTPSTPLIFQYDLATDEQDKFSAVPNSRPLGALPTNAWWLNMALDDGSAPIACPPYLLRLPTNTTGGSGRERTFIEVSWPNLRITEQAMWQEWMQDWRLSWQRSTPMQRRITHWDDVSATVAWQSSDNSQVTLPLVKATPYLTLLCQQMRALRLDTPHRIVSVREEQPAKKRSSSNSDRVWSITLQNGQTWALFALPGSADVATGAWQATQSPGRLQLRQDGAGQLHLQSDGPFTGTLRLAGVPGGTAIQDNLALLKRHSGVWPVGGRMWWRHPKRGGPLKQQLKFRTMGHRRQSLLMLAQPHHLQTLHSPKPRQAAFNHGNGYRTTKGRMYAVIGDRWQLHETMPSVHWHGLSAPLDRLPSGWVAQLRAALAEDVHTSQRPNSTESYWFGKAVARMARLAMVAEKLDRVMLPRLLDTIEQALHGWLEPTEATAFRYDTTHGGILTATGGTDKPEANFGHAIYNDHHFHHGYFVFAAAVLARHRPVWLRQNRDAVFSVCMDYMYRGTKAAVGPFARFRHFDLYDGHSWTSGLGVAPEGRNQESSSEAVHAYYAAALWAKVARAPQLATDAQMLLAMELRAAHIYWQMTLDPMPATGSSGERLLRPGQDSDDASLVYPLPYRRRGTTGILWASKADHTTWFGDWTTGKLKSRAEYIHGIQMLPFTPITRQLLSVKWLGEIDEQLQEALRRPEPPMQEGWRGFLWMAQALLATRQSGAATPERAAALQPYWTRLNEMSEWDNGNSRTNALDWIASLYTHTHKH